MTAAGAVISHLIPEVHPAEAPPEPLRDLDPTELAELEAFADEEYGDALSQALARIHVLEHALDLITATGVAEVAGIAAKALGSNNTMDVGSAVEILAGASGVNPSFLNVAGNVVDAYQIARRQLSPAHHPRLTRARDLVLEKFAEHPADAPGL